MTKSADAANQFRPKSAIVLAAGLGERMRPITATKPKPLVKVAGKALIDHVLDRLAAAGIAKAVVNVHYLADMIEAHVVKRKFPAIEFSDERQELLETGGGVFKALPKLGNEPFLILNSDSFWIEGNRPNIEILIDAWDEQKMDMLLMLAPTANSFGYTGMGDFAMDQKGRLNRRNEREKSPFAYAGVCIAHPSIFANANPGRFSLNRMFDAASENKRLFGVQMDGLWLHVGSPDAIDLANQVVRERVL